MIKLRKKQLYLLSLVFGLMCIISFWVVGADKETKASQWQARASRVLNSAEGPLAISDFRDNVVLIFFGYTSCPSVCPITLATMGKVLEQLLPADLKRTKALFISLDPEKDTVEVLKQYTGYFHKNIIGLTADTDVLNNVTEQYDIKFEKILVPKSALGYVISHPTDIIVLGLNGEVKRTFEGHNSTIPLRDYITYLLNE